MSDFTRELSALLNKHSIENESDTPDFILAEYLNECLGAFARVMDKRENWYGRGTVEAVETSASIQDKCLKDLAQHIDEHEKRSKI
jgi:hypothetical protein